MSVLEDVQAEMDARARALLQRLHERDQARGWPVTPICWPGRSPAMDAADYWPGERQAEGNQGNAFDRRAAGR